MLHATIQMNGNELEVSNVDGERVTVIAGGKSFPLPPKGATQGSVTATGGCTVQLVAKGAAVASVSVRHPRIFDATFHYVRYCTYGFVPSLRDFSA
jgi:hypothetical protein